MGLFYKLILYTTEEINLPSQSEYPAMFSTFFTPLDDLAILELTGAQPAQLLQGQITADLNLVTPTQALPALLCDLKGRVVSSFEVVYLGSNHLALILPSSSLPAVESHLAKYQPFFKTKIQNTTANYQLLGLSGKEAPALASSLIGAWPKQEYHQALTDLGLVLNLPGPQPRALILLRQNDPTASTTVEKLTSLTNKADTDCWHLLDIKTGRAQVDARLATTYLPQMLNCQATGAVSFKKGCYIGQEIVARAQFRGQVKKRLYRGHLPTSLRPGLPAGVYDAKGKQQGEIIQLAADRRGEFEALAVINTKAIEEELALFANPELSIKFIVLKLPYDPASRAELHLNPES